MVGRGISPTAHVACYLASGAVPHLPPSLRAGLVYNVQEACCLRCCSRHVCVTNTVDCTCPLFVNDNCLHSCPITGVVVREVLHSTNKYLDHVQQVVLLSHQWCCEQAVELNLD